MPSEFQQKFDRELDSGLRGLDARKQRRSLMEIRDVSFCSNDYPGLAENVVLHEAVVGCGA
jgi:7-keto-8-aminopelargonate synthetase-like enzyme